MPAHKATDKLSKEDLQWLNDKLLTEDYDSYVQLEYMLKDKGYDIGKSSVQRHRERLLEEQEVTLSDEEKQLILLFRKMSREERDKLILQVFRNQK
ncbi:MAG: DUF3486 family protein [Moraxellaceae bacterium]|nr:DUF3486 family protein [Moraxellaceae bacterium]